jgi:AraC-like DNA-binding protein
MRSVESIDYQDVPRPVAAMAVEYRSGSRDSRHKHRRAQLLYATTGVLTVVTDEGTWTVPPQRAVWLPGGVEHEVIFRGDVSLRTLYVEPLAVAQPLPTRCKVIELSELLRSLILEAMLVPTEYALGDRDERLMLLLLDEIVRMPTAPLHMRMPTDERLLRVCRLLVATPDDARDLDEWAASANMSRRSFTRKFRLETGQSFSDWRQQARIFEALALLATGKSVTATAFEVGYGSVSAFTAMFRRCFGVAPTAYLSDS